MPHRELSSEEILRVLAGQQLARVAFHDGESPYLIPLGYVLLDGALQGVTKRGRKTRIAATNPRVAFQVDTSSTTGLFEWRSVTGEGRFEIVGSATERRRTLAALRAVAAPAPTRWQLEQAARLVAGELEVWKIVLTKISGRLFAAS